MESPLVLVIDDDEDIIEQVRSILEPEGVRVIFATNGAQGLKLLENNCPEVVLCDMMMDEVDEGLQVCRRFRGRCTKTPFFLLSSIAEVSSMNFDVLSEGFSGVIQKPLTRDKLLALLNPILNKD